jgi:hypothetical protein
MMSTLFFLTTSSVFAGGFGGAELGAAMELDTHGAAYLLELDVEPFRQNKGDNRLVWAPFHISFVLGEADPVTSVDRVELAVIKGARDFENTLVHAAYRAGLLTYDSEAQFVDLTAAEGGVSFPIWGDLMRAEVGLDLRTRFLFPEGEASSIHLSLGVPVKWIAETPRDRPNSARAELGLRPGMRLIGDRPMALNAHAKGSLGYAIVQADDIELRVGLSYGFHHDNATSLGAFWAHRFSAGFSATF